MGLFGCEHVPRGSGTTRIERIYPFLGDYSYSYREMIAQYECENCSAVYVKVTRVDERMIEAVKEFDLQESLKKSQPEKESI